MNGFVGEFLILLGAFKLSPWVTAISATGVILAAVYLLWMFQRVMFGPITSEKNRGLPDLSIREFWTLAPVIFFIVWIGVYPNTFLRKLDVSVEELLKRVESRSLALSGEEEPAVPAPEPEATETEPAAPSDSTGAPASSTEAAGAPATADTGVTAAGAPPAGGGAR